METLDEEKRKKVELLCQIGFEESASITALRDARGDVQAAVTALVQERLRAQGQSAEAISEVTAGIVKIQEDTTYMSLADIGVALGDDDDDEATTAAPLASSGKIHKETPISSPPSSPSAVKRSSKIKKGFQSLLSRSRNNSKKEKEKAADAAKEASDDAGTPPPGADHSVLLTKASVLLKKKEYEEVDKLVEPVTRAEPTNALAWYQLACAQANLLKINTAVQALRKSMDLGFDDFARFKSDEHLKPLHSTDGWQLIVALFDGAKDDGGDDDDEVSEEGKYEPIAAAKLKTASSGSGRMNPDYPPTPERKDSPSALAAASTASPLSMPKKPAPPADDDYMSGTLELWRFRWFHGHLGREEADEILHNKPKGSFLIRNSSRAGAFAVVWQTTDDGPTNTFLVLPKETGGYQIAKEKEERHYVTVMDVLRVFKSRLKHPIDRKVCDHHDGTLRDFDEKQADYDEKMEKRRAMLANLNKVTVVKLDETDAATAD